MLSILTGSLKTAMGGAPRRALGNWPSSRVDSVSEKKKRFLKFFGTPSDRKTPYRCVLEIHRPQTADGPITANAERSYFSGMMFQQSFLNPEVCQ